MDTVLEFMKIVALLCVSVLSIYLMVVLIRLQKIFSDIQRDINSLTSKMIPVFTNLEAITSKMRAITDGMKEEFEMVRYSVRALRDMVENIVDFERQVQNMIEEPIMESVTTFTAVAKGVKTFFQYLRI